MSSQHKVCVHFIVPRIEGALLTWATVSPFQLVNNHPHHYTAHSLMLNFQNIILLIWIHAQRAVKVKKEEGPILLFSGHKLPFLHLLSALNAPSPSWVLHMSLPIGSLLPQVACCLLFDHLSPVTSVGQSPISFWVLKNFVYVPPLMVMILPCVKT